MSLGISFTDEELQGGRALYLEAYRAVLPEAQAIPENQLLHPGATDADTIIRAVLPRLPMLSELDVDAAELPKFGHHDYSQLGVRVRALRQAESQHIMALTPPAALDEKLEKLVRVKNFLLAQAEVLILAGAISAGPVEALKFNTGHRQMAANTRHVLVYLLSQWDAVAPHTTMKREQLEDYQKFADHVQDAVIARDDQPKRAAKSALERRQIFTLVLRSLRQLRRAALYFYEDEAEDFLPRVYANTGKRARLQESQEPVVPAPAASKERAEAPANTVVDDDDGPFIR